MTTFEKIKASFYYNPCDKDWGDANCVLLNEDSEMIDYHIDPGDPFCFNTCELEEQTRAVSEGYSHKKWILNIGYPLIKRFTVCLIPQWWCGLENTSKEDWES